MCSHCNFNGRRILLLAITLIIALGAFAAFTTAAWAGVPHGGDPDVTSSSNSTALGLGVGVGLGLGIGQGGDAESNALGIGLGGEGGKAFATGGDGGNASALGVGGKADAVGIGGSSDAKATAFGEQEQTALAVNDGNHLATSFSSNDRSYALGLSPATAAPFDVGVCRIKQTAGWDVRVVARSGRNVFDETCLKCERLVSRYLQLGQTKLALAVLAREECGGEPVPAELEVIQQEVIVATRPDDGTSERLERMFQALQSK